jgi:uncharacterized membrane protein
MMWEEIINTAWVKLGLFGLVLVGLVWLVVVMDKRYNRRVKEHKEERLEWMAEIGRQHKETIEVQKETNNTINNFAQAVYEMKGMLKR